MRIFCISCKADDNAPCNPSLVFIKRFFLICLLVSSFVSGVRAGDIVVAGTVRNNETGKKIASVSLTVPDTNIGTVSNTDGSFSLKVPEEFISNGVKLEQIGYKGFFLSEEMISRAAGKPLTVRLEPSERMLKEVMVYGADPYLLIETAISKIPDNYSSSENLFSAFYRETVKKGNRFIGVSEAILSVRKGSYCLREIYSDRVKIDKGRRLVSQRSDDTLAVKISGGPLIPVTLDLVKNEDLLFNQKELAYYDFKMEPVSSIDDRLQFVVSFRPVVKVDYPLYKGKVFIDMETNAFTRAEFSLDTSDKDKATRSILRKKPRGLRFKPQDVDFIVTYKYQDGKSYLNYISARTKFKCDWKRKLFSAGYTVEAELVMVDRDDSPAATVNRKDAFKEREIFSDKVDDFIDPDFWKDYNIIEPTESLEKAVIKLSR